MVKKSLPPKLWSCFDHYGHAAWFALLLVILLHILPATTGQTIGPEVDPDNNKSVATIMGIVALMFLLSGFLSLYSGKCIDRNSRGARFDLANLPTTTGRTGSRSQTGPRSNGLNQEVIDTFPTFLYSNVKGLKIGKGTLACAVCLNEFEDDETLRLIPKCSHVYHYGCIDAWLASHSTCPVCRANLLVSSQNDNTTMSPTPTVVSIQLASESTQRLEHVNQNEEEPYVVDMGEEHNREDGADVESPKVDFLRRCRTVDSYYQSRTTRSNSVGGRDSVLVQPGENCERFTLRLPDEVRNQMMNSTLKRAKSCVSFARMSSGTWGYRTRSIVGCGLGLGRGHVQHERFGSEEQSGFVRNGWNNNNNNNRSVRKSSPPVAVVRCLGVALDHNNVGERSSDSLVPLRIA